MKQKKKRRCYSCKSFKTYKYHTDERWLHLPSDKKHWYCMNCYGKDRYRRFRTQILVYQRKYQKQRYEELRVQILSIRKQQRDEHRKIAFKPRSIIGAINN